MKLNAKVTSLRTGGRMELTIVTSASGLEQVITADNGGYALDDEVVVLVLTKEQAAQALWDMNDSGVIASHYPGATTLADQLRPDAPPPWEQSSAAVGPRAGQSQTPCSTPLTTWERDIAEAEEANA